MRRWPAPVLGLAAALLFGYVVTHRVPVAPPPPAPVGTPAPTGLQQVTGPRAAGPAGLRMLVDGRRPAVVEPGTGRTTAVEGLVLQPGERARLQAVPAGMVATVTGRSSRSRTTLLARSGTRTGSRTSTGSRRPGTPGGGEFSPDGRWLALAVPGQYRDGRLRVVPGFAAVVDLRTGAVTEVPVVRSAAEREPAVSWSGGTLVLAVWAATRGRLAAWTPGPGPVTVLPVEPAGDDRSTATVLP